MKVKSTSELMDVLNSTSLSTVNKILKENESSLFDSTNPFGDYFRRLLREKEMTMQEVFLKAEIPERYGYKIVSGEKRTKQRDYILKLCFVAGLNLEETQHALELYKLNPLYPRIRRDAILIIALNQNIHEIKKINHFLTTHEELELAETKKIRFKLYQNTPLIGCFGVCFFAYIFLYTFLGRLFSIANQISEIVAQISHIDFL